MNPAQYWRQTKQWSTWIGREGTVVTVTTIRVAPAGLETFVPYDYAVVEFDDGERAEFRSAAGEKLAVGKRAHCVLRRASQPDKLSVVPYCITLVSGRMKR